MRERRPLGERKRRRERGGGRGEDREGDEREGEGREREKRGGEGKQKECPIKCIGYIHNFPTIQGKTQQLLKFLLASFQYFLKRQWRNVENIIESNIKLRKYSQHRLGEVRH